MRRVLTLLRHMKESGGSIPSTYVTPKRRRKRGSTDFTNRKLRQRRVARKWAGVQSDLRNAPLKCRGVGLPLALKFCSIRKLILESIVEGEEESLDDTVADQVIVSIEENRTEMSEDLGFNCEGSIESPQPSFDLKDSRSNERDSRSEEDRHSSEVSLLPSLRNSNWYS